jgi:hypothetical protein
VLRLIRASPVAEGEVGLLKLARGISARIRPLDPLAEEYDPVAARAFTAFIVAAAAAAAETSSRGNSRGDSGSLRQVSSRCGERRAGRRCRSSGQAESESVLTSCSSDERGCGSEMIAVAADASVEEVLATRVPWAAVEIGTAEELQPPVCSIARLGRPVGQGGGQPGDGSELALNSNAHFLGGQEPDLDQDGGGGNVCVSCSQALGVGGTLAVLPPLRVASAAWPIGRHQLRPLPDPRQSLPHGM